MFMKIATKKSASKLGAFAAVPLMVALFTGCSSGVPAEGEHTKSSDSNASAKITDFKDWQLALSTCIRAEGVEVADPSADGSQTIDIGNSNEEALKAASDKCIAKIGEAPARSGEKKQSDQQMQDDQLKAAKCLRDSGYDVPDPVGGGLGLPRDVSAEAIKKCVPAAKHQAG